ncbi:hypothetical protein TRVL_01226 [Trypanosoma vivax]|nr:hypothetical protein TRVL_01226 [Trypanosoma vivax]
MGDAPLVNFRQHSFVYGSDSSVLHVSQQCFSDYIWILVTEDDTCMPGVVLRFDPTEEGPCAVGGGVGTLPSFPCEHLLGVRDHPLTNVLAGALAHSISKEGERRPLLLCISITKTAERLKDAAERLGFVREIVGAVTGAGIGDIELDQRRYVEVQ